MPAPRGMKPTVNNPAQVLKRILNLVFKRYKFACIFVALCIVVNVFSTLQGTMFIRTLIDDFIIPLLKQDVPDYTALSKEILRVGCIYLVGVLASFGNAKTMVYVTQGTLKYTRDELFHHMESLPIRYFDTHSHGDIMSVYTNDVDTLRQMISQSMPQFLNSIIMIVGIVISMVSISLPLTGVAFVMVAVMIILTKKVSGLSGKYFVAQQRDLGSVNGYIEEMMAGQKVVKVFCHEEEGKEKFKELNDRLFDSAYNANKYANIIGPINAQLGNLSYVVIAIAGGLFAIYGIAGVTIGGLVSFLTLSKSLNMPINQISMQFNSIIMALAGGERIFSLLDEKPEVDEGYVTLVNAVKKDGVISETKDRTGLWAWKHYHKENNTTDYIELKGDVEFFDVDLDIMMKNCTSQC